MCHMNIIMDVGIASRLNSQMDGATCIRKPPQQRAWHTFHHIKRVPNQLTRVLEWDPPWYLFCMTHLFLSGEPLLQWAFNSPMKKSLAKKSLLIFYKEFLISHAHLIIGATIAIILMSLQQTFSLWGASLFIPLICEEDVYLLFASRVGSLLIMLSKANDCLSHSTRQMCVYYVREANPCPSNHDEHSFLKSGPCTLLLTHIRSTALTFLWFYTYVAPQGNLFLSSRCFFFPRGPYLM